MHLYKVMWDCPHDGDRVVWCGTQEAAKQEIKDQRDGPQYGELDADERPKFKTEAVDVPTSKPELIEWLNKHKVS